MGGLPVAQTLCAQDGSGKPVRRYNVVMSAAHDSLLYARVETVLVGEITDGGLKIGDQLPTEESLVARFGVSRITVPGYSESCEPRSGRDSPWQRHIRRCAKDHAGSYGTERICGGHACPWAQTDGPRDRQR